MCVFLWFALFRKRTESRLFVCFFFYGKVQAGDDQCTAIFERNTPFYCLFIMFLDFFVVYLGSRL